MTQSEDEGIENAYLRAERPEEDHLTYVTFNSVEDIAYEKGTIVDSGAYSSVVGKKKLDATLSMLKIERLPDSKPMRETHRFGTSTVRHKTLCSLRFPFCSTNWTEPLFDIQFDVINGDLSFLVGLSSLISIKASINFNFKW